MPNPLGDDAAQLIKQAQEYLEHGQTYWDPVLKLLMVDVAGTPCGLADLPAVLNGTREMLISKIIDHLMEEVRQSQYNGGHGSRTTYTRGCRGLLCRRANREELRTKLGQSQAARFVVPDELLDEAESRILPEEVVGHIRYSDKVVSA